ncbi:molybdopterin-binding/glycosyltransferase family 2 protein [Acuticoccus sp. M5D2P5]|uniref:NTP transferase domain-containing protein n=1 Tax=Acuticoccus kalidii TaxID=2910977 RepID=UPI001F1F7BA8|nr:molybdopterin-binding/glycosyltransferase family 2 protein [Acuticoccus kalidii]
MKFGPVPVAEAAGAILAHSQRTESGVIRKGTRLSQADVESLRAAGIAHPVVARLDPDDVHEDDAARRLAEAVAGAGVTRDRADTGRANLFAAHNGLVAVRAADVDAFNAVDPALTLATLPAFQRVTKGQMVGTVKIIPFAAPETSVAAAIGSLNGGILDVAPWRIRRVAAISTTLPSLKESVIDKTLSIFDRRLADPGAVIASERRVPHAVEPLAEALRDAVAKAELSVVFGASAVVDAHDVIPAAIEAAGGRVIQVGMPVDPGNLLVLGEIGGHPVIGAPGCARSPKVNGFDFVLDRLLAGLTVTPEDIMRMGVGGLLVETAVRPRPRRGTMEDGKAEHPAAIILAAGRSSRMGAVNKLLEEVGGRAMVRRVAEAALASRAGPVVVVTGHEAERVAAALDGLDVVFVHNADYPDGLSTSLRAGLGALPPESDSAIILLGDMPLIRAGDIDRVLAGLGRNGALIAMATANGSRGNPVAWSNRLFPELRATEGDAGGRALLSRYSDSVVDVEIGDIASLDADTPTALAAVRARDAG